MKRYLAASLNIFSFASLMLIFHQLTYLFNAAVSFVIGGFSLNLRVCAGLLYLFFIFFNASNINPLGLIMLSMVFLFSDEDGFLIETLRASAKFCKGKWAK